VRRTIAESVCPWLLLVLLLVLLVSWLLLSLWMLLLMPSAAAAVERVAESCCQDNPVPDASVLLLTMHPPFLSIAAVARFY
jgi:hypothetical protein